MSTARAALVGRQASCGELVSTTEEAPPEEEDGQAAVAVLIAVLAVLAIAFGGG